MLPVQRWWNLLRFNSMSLFSLIFLKGRIHCPRRFLGSAGPFTYGQSPWSEIKVFIRLVVVSAFIFHSGPWLMNIRPLYLCLVLSTCGSDGPIFSENHRERPVETYATDMSRIFWSSLSVSREGLHRHVKNNPEVQDLLDVVGENSWKGREGKVIKGKKIDTNSSSGAPFLP